MKLIVKGQIFPKVWDLANCVKKLREERKQVNLGGGTMNCSVYEVHLPDSTKRLGNYLHTPQGVKLFFSQGNNYGIDYLISEIDDDPLVNKHFKKAE